MGHHYVPQRYLRQFEAVGKPDRIWQFEKPGGTAQCLLIKVVAQARKFYEPEVEILLGREVECPGSAAIERLLSSIKIDATERLNLGLYIGVMMSRVPARRKRVEEMIPDVLIKVMNNFRESVRVAATEMDVDPNRVANLLTEANRIERTYQQTLPKCISDQIREPWPSPAILGAIITMHWKIFTTNGPQYFVTSDNPFFFTKECGLGNLRSEFFMPLSPTHLLHGSRVYQGRELSNQPVPQRVVRQVNNRTVHEAEKNDFCTRGSVLAARRNCQERRLQIRTFLEPRRLIVLDNFPPTETHPHQSALASARPGILRTPVQSSPSPLGREDEALPAEIHIISP
jgi:hypothetical protein